LTLNDGDAEPRRLGNLVDILGPASNREPHALELGHVAKAVHKRQVPLDGRAIERQRAEEKAIKLAQDIRRPFAKPRPAPELDEAPLPFFAPWTVRNSEERAAELARPTRSVERATSESGLDDDDHVNERDEASVSREKHGLLRSHAVRHQRNVCATFIDHSLKERRVLGGVRRIETRRSDHRGACSASERAEVRCGVDSFGPARKHGHASSSEIVCQCLREAETSYRGVPCSNDRDRRSARQFAPDVKGLGRLGKIREAWRKAPPRKNS